MTNNKEDNISTLNNLKMEEKSLLESINKIKRSRVNLLNKRKKLVKLGNTNPPKETPTEAIPRALPVYFLNQREINLDTEIFPIMVTPRAIGKVKISMKLM